MKNFAGAHVAITGAGSGIGRLMALEFARRGSKLILIDRNGEAAAAVKTEVENRGGKAWAFTFDLNYTAEISELGRDILNNAGHVDCLVNNAGVIFAGEFSSVDLQKHLTTLNVNTQGVIALTHALYDSLKDARDGHLVNIASAAGLLGIPFGAVYSASKWAVVGFSESIRLELLEQKIDNLHVTTICPCYIDTGMFEGVSVPALLPLLKPEEITARIMLAIERNESMVEEPMMVKTVNFLRGVLPERVFDLTMSTIGVNRSMTTVTGRPGH